VNIQALFDRYKTDADACYNPAFFAGEKVLRYAEKAKLKEEHIQMLLRFLAYADDSLLRFIWQYYYLLFRSEADFRLCIDVVDAFPKTAASEETFPGCVASLIYLLAVENLEKWLADKDVNKEEILESYFFRYRDLADLNMLSHNTYALCRLSYFLYGYAKPVILRAGRLDFHYRKYMNYCEMYEDAAGNRIFAALPNYTYNQFGLQEPDGFRPLYQKDGDILTAHLFGEKGRLNIHPQQIDLKKYKPILLPGDNVVAIHIPEGGRMYVEDVKASIRKAHDLFTKYMPPYKAIVCYTWFIDPALRDDVIRDGSNMAAFADLFDIICGNDNGNHSIYEHVFKVKRQPLEDLKPCNAFQQRIVDRALRGEKIYWSYGLLKKEYCDALLQGRDF